MPMEKKYRLQYLLSSHNIQYFVEYKHGSKGELSSRTSLSPVASLPLICPNLFFLSQWLPVFNPFYFWFLVYILHGQGCAWENTLLRLLFTFPGTCDDSDIIKIGFTEVFQQLMYHFSKKQNPHRITTYPNTVGRVLWVQTRIIRIPVITTYNEFLETVFVL